MNFSERKAEAVSLVSEFLGDFVPPRGLDGAQLSSRVSMIADAFARKMPTTGNFQEHAESVFNRIRDTHESNTWPAQAVFVMAMPKRDAVGQGSAPETFRVPDPCEAHAKKMLEGLGVPEAALWAGTAHRLPSIELEAYRRVNIKQWADAYRHSAADRMAKKYGDIVRPYFA